MFFRSKLKKSCKIKKSKQKSDCPTVTDSENEVNPVSLPESLVSRLPDNSMIHIVSYGNEEQTNGKRYCVVHEYALPNEPFIQYKIKRINAWSQTDENINTVFRKSFHPFLEKYTDDSERCAGNIQMHFNFNPSMFEVTQDILRISFDSGYYKTGYKETHDYITYRESYQESTHDGGGSGDTEWYLYSAPEKKEIDELSHQRFLGWCKIPECKGYWLEDNHLYLVDPWDIPGVFEFYCSHEFRDDYFSDYELRTIGVKYSRTK